MVLERKNLKSIIILAVIVVICIIVITVSFKDSDALKKTRAFTLDVFQPVQEKTYLLLRPVAGFFMNIRGYFGLRQKLTDLQQENSLLLKDYSENINLKIENNSLRNLLQMKSRNEFQMEAAKVIGHYENQWQSLILIDSGKNNGISEGMAVVNEDGLVGVVTLASNNTSEIRLLNDPQSSIGSRVLSSRKLGMVEGNPEKKIFLNYIPEDDDIFQGDILVTSEFSEKIPPDILVGRIKKAGSSVSGNYLQLEVEPFVDFGRLEFVMVIKG